MGSVFKYSSLVYSGFMLPSRKDHYGTDLHPIDEKGRKVENAEVLATSNQKIVFAGWTNVGWGNLVKTEDKEYYYYYAHLSKVLCKAGDSLKDGQVLGIIGTTGNSTGIHLHYEKRKKGDRRPQDCIDPSSSCYVKNENGKLFPAVKNSAPVYKMREYEFSGETMTVEEFYKQKAETPIEIIGVGFENNKIKIARVVKASDTPYSMGKNLQENHYLY